MEIGLVGAACGDGKTQPAVVAEVSSGKLTHRAAFFASFVEAVRGCHRAELCAARLVTDQKNGHYVQELRREASSASHNIGTRELLCGSSPLAGTDFKGNRPACA